MKINFKSPKLSFFLKILISFLILYEVALHHSKYCAQCSTLSLPFIADEASLFTNLCKSMDVKKLCPFCDELFDGNTIKTHIGIEHLGIVVNQAKTNGTKNEIENDEVICATLTFQVRESPDQMIEFRRPKSSSSIKSGSKIHQSLQCQQCPKSFDKKRGLYEHVMRNHSNIKHHCEKCGRQFKRRDHLKLHQKRFQNLKMCKTKK